MYTVDINCDLGESFGRYKLGEQEEVLRYITSANIACGFHAGDPSVMRETVELAVKNNVQIGAHPGLPDLNGFGRREMKISPQEAYDIVVYQIGALQGFLTTKKVKMQHVKPHGALYNMAAVNEKIAQAIAQAVYDVSPELILYGLASSELTRAGEKVGLKTVHEVFADRTYQQDGTLTKRNESNALITDGKRAVAQIIEMIKEGTVTSVQNTKFPLQAHSICVHGDGEHAVQFAQLTRTKLEQQGIVVKAFQ
ncbi:MULTISPECIES: LamB/YcsF family protein [Solibacillus]|uniref:5-oxoprolinase subunit A n=1 Tax=Solibacillus merdavium TaxID=2762218 RepID=A0ABR8XQF4_9BACL|nr:5-oxoprolinase subunit PxpA [Solibacillus merdavium]MBD8034155.1 LamB/YcsF family protein [Solibacillus merdavium]